MNNTLTQNILKLIRTSYLEIWENNKLIRLIMGVALCKLSKLTKYTYLKPQIPNPKMVGFDENYPYIIYIHKKISNENPIKCYLIYM